MWGLGLGFGRILLRFGGVVETSGLGVADRNLGLVNADEVLALGDDADNDDDDDNDDDEVVDDVALRCQLDKRYLMSCRLFAHLMFQ